MRHQLELLEIHLMSKLHIPEVSHKADKPVTPSHPWRRILALWLLCLLSIVIYILLIGAAPKSDDQISPFLYVWMISFLPYFAACAFVLATKPLVGRWRWIELGSILLGAFLLRAILLPLPPGLSHDSWRYLLDARVTLHGFSPFVYAPGDKALAPLQDSIVYANSRYRNVPTLYPPGAQAVYLLSYLLAPANLYFLKGIFLVFDMVTCIALVVLLGRKGLDQRRVLLYAWCPLPIIEFAIQGHVDVITLTFTILAVLSAANRSVRGYMLTGFLIGVATLTKIYPILLLAALLPGGDDRHVPLMRRVKYHYIPLLVTCFATIIIGYLPYLILGHGQVFGYFASYTREQGQNAGVIQQITRLLGNQLHLPLTKTIAFEQVVDLLAVGIVSLIVFVQRWRNRISIEAATLLLFGVVLSISSHVFPWYTTTLLLWVPLLITNSPKPVGARVAKGGRAGLYGRPLAVIAAWYFTTTVLLGYFFNPGPGNPSPDWTVYYRLVYIPVMAALGVAAIIGVINLIRFQKAISHAERSPHDEFSR
jgi:Glycosyltransferase family 87